MPAADGHSAFGQRQGGRPGNSRKPAPRTWCPSPAQRVLWSHLGRECSAVMGEAVRSGICSCALLVRAPRAVQRWSAKDTPPRAPNPRSPIRPPPGARDGDLDGKGHGMDATGTSPDDEDPVDQPRPNAHLRPVPDEATDPPLPVDEPHSPPPDRAPKNSAPVPVADGADGPVRQAAEAFAAELIRLRTAAKLSQLALAQRLGYDKTYVTHLERCTQAPTQPVARQADEFFGSGEVLTRLWRAYHTARTASRRQQSQRPTHQTPPRPAPAALHSTLPRDIAAFTGREGELHRLLRAAEDGRAPVISIHTVDGMAGVGKTALVTHAAHQLAKRYPDGHRFVDLHAHTAGQPPADPTDVLVTLLISIGISPQSLPDTLGERAALWRDRLAGLRMLLVLDNAASPDQVEPLLPASQECLVLVTKRRQPRPGRAPPARVPGVPGPGHQPTAPDRPRRRRTPPPGHPALRRGCPPLHPPGPPYPRRHRPQGGHRSRTAMRPPPPRDHPARRTPGPSPRLGPHHLHRRIRHRTGPPERTGNQRPRRRRRLRPLLPRPPTPPPTPLPPPRPPPRPRHRPLRHRRPHQRPPGPGTTPPGNPLHRPPHRRTHPPPLPPPRPAARIRPHPHHPRRRRHPNPSHPTPPELLHPHRPNRRPTPQHHSSPPRPHHYHPRCGPRTHH